MNRRHSAAMRRGRRGTKATGLLGNRPVLGASLAVAFAQHAGKSLASATFVLPRRSGDAMVIGIAGRGGVHSVDNTNGVTKACDRSKKCGGARHFLTETTS